jgi:taurine dioxygenase
MPISIKDLPGSLGFGAEVEGLAIADLSDAALRARLRQAWYDKGVLVFRDMPPDPEAQIELTRVFGEIELHPVLEMRARDHPELVHLKYRPDDGDVYEVDGEIRGGFLPWHSDLIFVDRINRGGILRITNDLPNGGQTGFVDKAVLYDTLSEEVRNRIETLHIVYRANFDSTHKKFGQQSQSLRLSRNIQHAQEHLGRYSPVIHPAVFLHPQSGRKTLNISPWMAESIYEMPGQEGDDLLAELIAHCEDDRRAYFHKWRPNDMVAWDNWRMLHCARGVPPEEARVAQRTTILGDYAMGRIMPGEAAIADEARITV